MEIGCDRVVMAVIGVVVMVTIGFGCNFSVMAGVTVLFYSSDVCVWWGACGASNDWDSSGCATIVAVEFGCCCAVMEVAGAGFSDMVELGYHCPPSHTDGAAPSPGSDYDCYSVNGDVECDPQSDFDKSSTIPRNSNIAQNYRRMIQTKRPASTAGLPTGTNLPAGTTPGVATIRRTPSTKPSVRRTLSNAGPIPIRPPIVPVKTPTVPDSPGYAGPTRVGSEECVFYADDASPNPLDFAKASPKRLSLPNTAWGGGAMEISVYPGAGQHLSAEEEEDQQLAANRHSLVEKIGELVAGAHALGEGQFPFPTALVGSGPGEETPAPPPAASMDPPAEDMLVAIRRGVRLRRTVTNDRSAPRIS